MSIDHAARTAVNATLDRYARRYAEASPEKRRKLLLDLSGAFEDDHTEAEILVRLEHIARRSSERMSRPDHYCRFKHYGALGYALAVRAEMEARRAA